MAEQLAVDGDDLAGVVDLFGALTREELQDALRELAFKQGIDPPEEGTIDDAIDGYLLVEHEGFLHPGPVAFPSLPPGAEDLPHILAIDARDTDTAAVARAVETRFRQETARALGAEDEAAVTRLLDVSYDLDAWGPVDLGTVRERLDAAAASSEQE